MQITLKGEGVTRSPQVPVPNLPLWVGARKGDRFTHPSQYEAMTIESITATAGPIFWLWAEGRQYPLAECQPEGLWGELVEQFIEDLTTARDWPAVEAIALGLSAGQKREIWAAMTEAQMELIQRLKDGSN